MIIYEYIYNYSINLIIVLSNYKKNTERDYSYQTEPMNKTLDSDIEF